MTTTDEPAWLSALRTAAVNRPRTQFQRIRWAHLQILLREYDALLHDASPETLERLKSARQHDAVRTRY